MIFSIYKIRKFIHHKGIILALHSSLNFIFCIFAITTLTSIWITQYSHLKALTVLLLTTTFFTSTASNMP